jgi:hypothetical protein
MLDYWNREDPNDDYYAADKYLAELEHKYSIWYSMRRDSGEDGLPFPWESGIFDD